VAVAKDKKAKKEASFLKKRSKKLLFYRNVPTAAGALQVTKFFAFFCSQKEDFSFPTLHL